MQTLQRLITGLVCALAFACVLVPTALAQTPAPTPPSNNAGASPDDPALHPPGKAILVGGLAIAPVDAPPEVQGAINAANKIVRKPYRYGGGHARFRDSGYDCSGTVSYVLHAAGVLRRPRASGDLMRFGARGHEGAEQLQVGLAAARSGVRHPQRKG